MKLERRIPATDTKIANPESPAGGLIKAKKRRQCEKWGTEVSHMFLQDQEESTYTGRHGI